VVIWSGNKAKWQARRFSPTRKRKTINFPDTVLSGNTDNASR